MSHSLHRIGKEKDLEQDYVILSMGALRHNKMEAGEKLKTISKIMIDNDPVNMGDAGYGSLMMNQTTEDFRSERQPKVITATYDNPEAVKKTLGEIKEEHLGVSVVVSGLMEKVEEIVEDIGLEMHTVNLSAGVHGKTELLADEAIREFTTMCGHHLIAPDLVTDTIDRYKKGKITLDEAAARLGKNCVCGLFNTTRAKELILKHAREQQ